jgi:malonyl-CoA O-methyltransferase
MQNLNKRQIQKNFARKAGLYEENARLQKRVVMELLSRAGKLGGAVLDVGAGTGLIRANAIFTPIELDFTYEMCAKSAKTGGLAVNADAENLPFADGSIDHIISSLTIQWLNDLDKFAAEMQRVLAVGGSFHLSTFGNGTLDELKFAFNYLDGDEHLIKFPSTIFLFALLKKAGFTAIEIHAQTITYRHDNVMEILYQMKNIGATYPLARTHKGLVGKRYFAKLENAYRSKYAGSDGKLPVTWNVLYISGKKL